MSFAAGQYASYSLHMVCSRKYWSVYFLLLVLVTDLTAASNRIPHPLHWYFHFLMLIYTHLEHLICCDFS